jgi:hypothetical protein
MILDKMGEEIIENKWQQLKFIKLWNTEKNQ